jgi:hypothetical protein
MSHVALISLKTSIIHGRWRGREQSSRIYLRRIEYGALQNWWLNADIEWCGFFFDFTLGRVFLSSDWIMDLARTLWIISTEGFRYSG